MLEIECTPNVGQGCAGRNQFAETRADSTGRNANMLFFSRRRENQSKRTPQGLIGLEIVLAIIATASALASCSGEGDEGDACASSEECNNGLICRSDSQTCEKPGKDGQYCVSDEDCASGLFCNQVVDSATEGTCISVIEEGEPCYHNDECCGGCQCIPSQGMYSDVCSRLEEGSPCDVYARTDYGDPDCGEGLFCYEETERCQVLGTVEEGSSCDDDKQCMDGLHCSHCYDNRVCQSLRGEKEFCCDDSDCLPEYVCLASHDYTCGPPNKATLGESCQSNTECAESLNCNHAFDAENGHTGQCQPLQPDSGPCVADGDCVSGLVCIILLEKCSSGGVGAPCEPGLGDKWDCDDGLYCKNNTCSP